MKAAIIAAGTGDRLRAAGIAEPKPLVRVAGRPLIDYALSAIEECGIRQVACIVNEQSSGIEDYCTRTWPQLTFSFVRRTTPSSMESLFTLSPLLHQRFVLMTTDAIFAPPVLSSFLEAAARRPSAHGVLALTDFVDDEKPLWARADERGRIVALGDSARGSGLVTAGFYVLEPAVFDEIEAARKARFAALRQFLGHLLEAGYRIDAEVVGRTVDVDRVEDLAVAEAYVRSAAFRQES